MISGTLGEMDTDLPTALRAAGLRATPGRLAVLEALSAHPHSHAETLRVESAAGLSIQSVHNVLADLTAARMIRRIEPAGSAALYERRIGDNHHHVVCTTCGAVADVDCAHGSAPCLTPNDTSGYAIATAEVTFWGLCANCQESVSPRISVPPTTSLLPTTKEIDQ